MNPIFARPVTPAYRGLVLFMLLLVYIFNFLDRQILGILVQPIKADLDLTDTQLGALGSVAFAILYSTLAIPLALIADRTSRSWVITISLVVWSGFTALCGTATSFWQLFGYRLGVGVGEAGGVAPSYAMIADYFPPESRARALAIYSLGVPIGLAGGAILGGYIAATVNWRTAFVVVGVAGIVIAPFFRLIVREPVRGGAEPSPSRSLEGSGVGLSEGAVLSEKSRSPTPPASGRGAEDRSPIAAVFAILARKPSFWLMGFAAAFSSMCGYGLAFWLPSVLIRSFGFDLLSAALFIGSVLLIGGSAGVLLGGSLADRFGTKDRGAYAKLPAIAWIVTIPFFAAALLAPSPVVAWFLFLIPNGLNILWLGPVNTAIQGLVPPQMRASASACFLLINNLIGLGLGSLVMGAMSDAMTARFGAEALRYSTVAALGFYAIAAALMLLAVKHLRRDWVTG